MSWQWLRLDHFWVVGPWLLLSETGFFCNVKKPCQCNAQGFPEPGRHHDSYLVSHVPTDATVVLQSLLSNQGHCSGRHVLAFQETVVSAGLRFQRRGYSLLLQIDVLVLKRPVLAGLLVCALLV